jgi:hypothetical protein
MAEEVGGHEAGYCRAWSVCTLPSFTALRDGVSGEGACLGGKQGDGRRLLIALSANMWWASYQRQMQPCCPGRVSTLAGRLVQEGEAGQDRTGQDVLGQLKREVRDAAWSSQ